MAHKSEQDYQIEALVIQRNQALNDVFIGYGRLKTAEQSLADLQAAFDQKCALIAEMQSEIETLRAHPVEVKVSPSPFLTADKGDA